MINLAHWIWCDAAPETENQHCYFRRRFQLPAAPAQAVLQCCADTRYRLYVNGTYIDFGPSRYAVDEPAYDTHDITDFLRDGDNVIALHVHAYGKLKRCSSCIPIRGGLIAAVAIDGQPPMLTGADWLVHRCKAYQSDTPRHSNHQGFVECFDARLAVQRWQEIGFDDRDWQQATPLGTTRDLPPWQRLIPRDVPPLTCSPRTPSRLLELGRLCFSDAHNHNDLAQLAPALTEAQRTSDASVIEFAKPGADLPATVQDGYAIFDFSENAPGFVRISLHGDSGSIVDFAYSESISEGVVESNKQGIRYVDRMILGDDAIEHTIMLPKTLRYLLVHVRGQATIYSIHHDVSHYPLRWVGRYYSSDDVLDTAWRVGAHTVAISTEDVYLDTPRRERAGWLGDMMPQAIAAYHAFGDYQLAKHSLDLYFHSQNAPGLYVEYPNDMPGWLLTRYPSIDPGPMPDYLASVAITVHDYVMYSGDIDFVNDHWKTLTTATDYVSRYINTDGLVEIKPDDCIASGYVLIDWSPLDRNGACSALNMLFYGHLRAMADLADISGETRMAEHYRKQSLSLVSAIRANLFDANRGIFVNGRIDQQLNPRAGYHENLFALLWPIASDQQRALICEHLLHDEQPLPVWEPEENYEMYHLLHRGEAPPWDNVKPVPIGSPYFAYFALWALFDCGHTIAALNTIRSQYGNCLARGATSLWEEWNGSKSHSHGWGAGPTSQLLRYIVGIAPTSPGFATCDVLPSFGDLKHASGCVPTPSGMIQASWQHDGQCTQLDVTVPPNSKVRAGFPVDAVSLEINGEMRTADRLSIRRGTFATVDLAEGQHTLRTRMH